MARFAAIIACALALFAAPLVSAWADVGHIVVAEVRARLQL